MLPEIDSYIDQANQWQDEFRALREILLDTPLREAYKWRQPCYTFGGKNVLIMSGFKEYCCLSFFKGSLLNDPQHLLEAPGKHSRATRQLRFENVSNIRKQKKQILAFITEAIQLEKDGEQVDFSKGREVPYPDELKDLFEEHPDFEKAFEELTPGRKRGYLIYWNGAKQSATRTNRIRKYMDKIFEGKGMQDR